MVGGPLGALLGAALGHQFDKGTRAAAEYGPGDQERVQTAFFTATFSVMGHLAKADGRVSEDEINIARQVMAQMHLSPEMSRAAIELFTKGKSEDFPLDDVLDQFRRECHGRRHLILMFVEIQLHAAYADGAMHAAEAEVMRRVCAKLGVPDAEFSNLDAIVRAAREFTGQAGTGSRPSPATRVRHAYEVLGVSAEATDAEVKKAYRRLMNRHHPDKLVSKGLPEEMIDLATEKTQEIKAAYETVKEARKHAV